MKFLFCIISAFFLVCPIFPSWVHALTFGITIVIAFWWSWCETCEEAWKK